MSKVHLPKGMRDLLPHNMLRRNLVIKKIKKIFEEFGFLPLETPSMERKETLMGKYGDEGSKLIFQVLAREKQEKRRDRFGLTLRPNRTTSSRCIYESQFKPSIQTLSNSASVRLIDHKRAL